MMRYQRGTFLVSILLGVSLLLPCLALQANLAGIVDWHKPLIGPPLLEPTPPRLVETSKGRVVVGLTRKNVLACLDAKTGDIVWRYHFEEIDPVVSYHVHDDVLLLLSGPSATTARLLSLTTGQVQWERPLHDIRTAHLTSPVHLGTDADFAADSVVVLSDGRRVSKLSLKDGSVQWSLDAPGADSTVLFDQILVSADTVHVLALTSSFSSTTLTTLSLSLATSVPLGDFTQIPSFVSNPSDAFLAAGSTSGSARVVWREHGRIRTASLSAAGQLGRTKDLLPGKGHKYGSLVDVGTRRKGLVLGKKENGAVQIVDVRDGAKIVDEFESSHDSADKSPSVYAAAVSGPDITFNRVYWSFGMSLAVTQTYTVSDNGDTISTSFTFPFDTASHGVVLAAAVSGTIGPAQLPQIVLTTSNHAIQLVTQEKALWTREESLADLAAVRFVDLGEREVEEVRDVLVEEDFVSRVTRHLTELKDLPGYLIRFANRFVSASYRSTLAVTPLNSTNLHRDQFGFQKLLVVVTTRGKVFAMDSVNGQAVWSVSLGLTLESGPEVAVEGMWLVREVGEGVNPTLAIIVTRKRKEGVETVGFHLDAFTGEVSGEVDEHTRMPLGKVLFTGKPETAFLTPFENCGTQNKVLAVVDSSHMAHIFPSCNKVAGDIAAMSPGLFFSTVTPSLSSSVISGHVLSTRHNTSFATTPTWSFTLAPGEVLQHNKPVSFGSVSSFGRVLGDKSTLYKYLNPHLTVLATVVPETQQANIHVVDTTTGRKVYSAVIRDVVVAKGVQVAMSENWLVYSWLDVGGWRVASVELYEDRSYHRPNTPSLSSLAIGHDVEAIAQTFIIPYEIKAMEMSASKFGITAKELVYVNAQSQVASIPRRLLDPRRPVGKPSASDKEEMLIPYDPFLPPDSRRVVSHKYPLIGSRYLISSPALVESTSLLFTHGIDLFLTRGLNPSGTFDILTDSFNKAQLLLTLCVLSVGIGFAQPAVRRKILRMRWF